MIIRMKELLHNPYASYWFFQQTRYRSTLARCGPRAMVRKPPGWLRLDKSCGAGGRD